MSDSLNELVHEYRQIIKKHSHVDLSFEEASEMMFDAACDFASELLHRLTISQASLAEVIRQRDALIARELRRQERARLASQCVVIQIWGGE